MQKEIRGIDAHALPHTSKPETRPSIYERVFSFS